MSLEPYAELRRLDRSTLQTLVRDIMRVLYPPHTGSGHQWTVDDLDSIHDLLNECNLAPTPCEYCNEYATTIRDDGIHLPESVCDAHEEGDASRPFFDPFSPFDNL